MGEMGERILEVLGGLRPDESIVEAIQRKIRDERVKTLRECAGKLLTSKDLYAWAIAEVGRLEKEAAPTKPKPGAPYWEQMSDVAELRRAVASVEGYLEETHRILGKQGDECPQEAAQRVMTELRARQAAPAATEASELESRARQFASAHKSKKDGESVDLCWYRERLLEEALRLYTPTATEAKGVCGRCGGHGRVHESRGGLEAPCEAGSDADCTWYSSRLCPDCAEPEPAADGAPERITLVPVPAKLADQEDISGWMVETDARSLGQINRLPLRVEFVRADVADRWKRERDDSAHLAGTYHAKLDEAERRLENVHANAANDARHAAEIIDDMAEIIDDMHHELASAQREARMLAGQIARSVEASDRAQARERAERGHRIAQTELLVQTQRAAHDLDREVERLKAMLAEAERELAKESLERTHASAAGMPDTYRKALEEVEAWRTGAEGGFGLMTANPHKSLTELAQRLEAHHQEHHAREAEQADTIADLHHELETALAFQNGYANMADEARTKLGDATSDIARLTAELESARGEVERVVGLERAFDEQRALAKEEERRLLHELGDARSAASHAGKKVDELEAEVERLKAMRDEILLIGQQWGSLLAGAGSHMFRIAKDAVAPAASATGDKPVTGDQS